MGLGSFQIEAEMHYHGIADRTEGSHGGRPCSCAVHLLNRFTNPQFLFGDVGVIHAISSSKTVPLQGFRLQRDSETEHLFGRAGRAKLVVVHTRVHEPQFNFHLLEIERNRYHHMVIVMVYIACFAGSFSWSHFITREILRRNVERRVFGGAPLRHSWGRGGGSGTSAGGGNSTTRTNRSDRSRVTFKREVQVGYIASRQSLSRRTLNSLWYSKRDYDTFRFDYYLESNKKHRSI